MRQLVLPFERQLGGGEPGRRIEEVRVVAEAAGASRRVDDRPVPRALGDDRLGIGVVPQQRQHAGVMRAAVGDAGERRDQLRVVAGVGLRLARVARALHARRAAERAHADAGIVGERRQLRVRARVPRLGERVLDERDVRLVRFGNAERRLRDHLDPERGEQPVELAQLAGIAGREDEARNEQAGRAVALAHVTHRAPPSAPR